jgi:hypothetical protein
MAVVTTVASRLFHFTQKKVSTSGASLKNIIFEGGEKLA